jgi:hypothetical protein
VIICLFVDQQNRNLHLEGVYIFVVSVVSLLRWNMWCWVVSVTAMVPWKHWNKFALVNGISVACIIYSHRQIHIRINLCLFIKLYLVRYFIWIFVQNSPSKTCKVLCYVNKTWRSFGNVVCSFWIVEGNKQHLRTAMVLIVGILATMFLCYHFHTEYSIPPCIFSTSLDCYASI